MTFLEKAGQETGLLSPFQEGRYRLFEQLGMGGMGRVYRAFDRLTGEVVALKLLRTPAGGHPQTPIPTLSLASNDTSDPRLLLAREFQAMSSLRHPHVLAVLDYGFNESQPYFTMELLKPAETIVAYTRSKSQPEQISLLIAVLQALAYIHRRGLLHRDLKPGNILVANEQVKVLDFGLSIDIERATGTVGTLAYMPPEVLFGNPAGVASDLYSFGIVAYEILTGRLPFESANLAAMLTRGDNENSLTLAPLPEPMQPLFAKLLAWQPTARYQDAGQLIGDLAAAMNQPIALETAAIRESFLQAARFVGRQTEFQQLKQAWIGAMDRQGGAWLVGGESGVGKSRLVNEIRTEALIRGGLVLRGAATTDGGSPFALWRDILRPAVLQTSLSELEAGVLKGIIPEMEELLEQEIPLPPTLPPADAQVRLFSTIGELLRRQQQPLLIILEDLQWATPESLALLNWLKRFLSGQPWLFLGNYRDDERADLPQLLPGFDQIKLKRLSGEGIAALVQSMVGVSGRDTTLLTFLQNETEGNPFFLVEVVRALAEEAGEMGKIEAGHLPEHVFTGGLQQLVNRRLGQVAPAGQPLLQLAAIGGRRLDLKVLQAIDPTIDLTAWLNDCANAAVLDVQDDRWQFAHDKLREGLLAAVPAGQHPALHQQIAQAMELAYPDQADMAPNLAFHWAKAGNLAKEAHYAALSGREALQSGANQTAITYFNRTLALDKQGVRPTITSLEKITIRRQLSQAYLALGRLEESFQVMRDALTLTPYPLPTNTANLLTAILSRIGLLLAYYLRPGWFPPFTAPQQVSLTLEVVFLYQQVGEFYYFANNQTNLLHANLTTLYLVYRSGSLSERARAYGSTTIIAGLIRLDRLAEALARQALEAGQAAANLPALAWVYLMTGLYIVSTGQWAKASHLLAQSMSINQQIGDKRVWGLAAGVQDLVFFYQGLFQESIAFKTQWHSVIEGTGNLQHLIVGLGSVTESYISLGQFETAQEILDQAFGAMDGGEVTYFERYRLYAIQAVLYLRQGNLPAAAHEADKAFAISHHIARPNSVILANGVFNTAEVYLALWAAGEDKYQTAAKQAVQMLKPYSRAFQIIAPRYWTMQGFYDHLRGNPAGANRAWHKALTLATQLAMPYEQALAHAYLGRYGSRPEQPHHLSQAANLFHQLGAMQPTI